MARRYDQGELTTAQMEFRVTPTVSNRIRGLAWYLRRDEGSAGYGRMLGILAERKRAALVADGKRPPLKAPNNFDWSTFDSSRGRRAEGDETERATQRMKLWVTPSEQERIQGLAYYLRIGISELFRLLENDRRQELLAEGKRPPLRPSDAEGPKSPRR